MSKISVMTDADELQAGDFLEVAQLRDGIWTSKRLDTDNLGGGGGYGVEVAASLIVPPDTTWYTNPGGYALTNLAKLHDGRWSGTSNYAEVGDPSRPHLVMDLQTERVLSHIEWVPYAGDNRAYKGVSWATSLDGVAWDWLLYTDPARVRQNYWGPHVAPATGRTARYVRYTAYGSTLNAYNHLDELMVWELVDPTTLPTP